MSRTAALTTAQAQLAAVRALHDDLRRQQPLVDALADCVVVVDDTDADRHDAGMYALRSRLRCEPCTTTTIASRNYPLR